MTCRETVDALGAYVDAELPVDVRARFDEHLATCTACSAYVATYREAVRLSQGAFDGPIPANIPEDLVQAILARRKS